MSGFCCSSRDLRLLKSNGGPRGAAWYGEIVMSDLGISTTVSVGANDGQDD